MQISELIGYSEGFIEIFRFSLENLSFDRLNALQKPFTNVEYFHVILGFLTDFGIKVLFLLSGKLDRKS